MTTTVKVVVLLAGGYPPRHAGRPFLKSVLSVWPFTAIGGKLQKETGQSIGNKDIAVGPGSSLIAVVMDIRMTESRYRQRSDD